MSDFTAGVWRIVVDEGGWPIWCSVLPKGGETIVRVRAESLADLAHVVERARIAARMEARKMKLDCEGI